MPGLRSLLLDARRVAAGPVRRARLRRLGRRQQAPLLVLFYHRVADTVPNGWTISTGDFERHLQLLSRDFEFIGLDEVQRRVRSGASPRPAVHLTFDDGYSENCRFALPLLIQRRIPATYFVTLENVQTGRPFPHDREAGVPLPPNSADELRALVGTSIEIGAHTRTHPDLGRVASAARIEDEIVGATAELQRMVGQRIRYFAFPYGCPDHLSGPAIRAVHRAALEGFCTAFGGYNLPGRDAFHIRRIHGDPELGRLRNWLSFDPRKVRLEPPVRYYLPPCRSWDATLEQIG